MKFCAILFVLAGTICAAQSTPAAAQPQASSETPQTGVVLTKLSPPLYPPLARQVRIMGDVELKVSIRQDGSVESAEVLSGHPMLKQAALDSAQKSIYECLQCMSPTTTYLSTYTFDLKINDCRPHRLRSPKCLYLWECGNWKQSPPSPAAEVTLQPGHVTVISTALCVQTISFDSSSKP